MASFRTSQYIDSLTVNSIYTKGSNNGNIPAYRVLATDGAGGTTWMTLSSLQYGAGYHTIQTSVGAFTADQATNATFSLLDGPNAGLIADPTAPNTAYLYAKAFSQFDISGGNTIYAYDESTNQTNSNMTFVGTGGINIRGDPQTNTIFFDGRELPYVSTLPYSFSRLLVYSNAPLNTMIASTLSSIYIESDGPSSIFSLVGEDMVVLKTDYATKQIHVSLSSISLSIMSSLIGNSINYGSSIDTLYNNLNFLTSTITGDIDNFTSIMTGTYSGSGSSTISTFYTKIALFASTIDSKINSLAYGNYNPANSGNSSSTISTIYTQIARFASTLDNSLLSLSSGAGLAKYGGDGSASSTVSTFYTKIALVVSTLDGSILGLSSGAGLAKFGGSGTASSTVSTFYKTFSTIVSTIDGKIGSLYSGQNVGTASSTISTLYTTINSVISTIDNKLLGFSTNNTLTGITASTISTLYRDMSNLTSSINGGINTFSSSLISYPGNDTSTISTVYTNILLFASSIDGGINTFSSVNTVLDLLNTKISTVNLYTSNIYTSSIYASNIDINRIFTSSINASTINTCNINTSNINASSITYLGYKQPFIQYGISVAPSIVTLPIAYVNNSYAIQLTYSNLLYPNLTIYAKNALSNTFAVGGDPGTNFYWTTFGNIF